MSGYYSACTSSFKVSSFSLSLTKGPYFQRYFEFNPKSLWKYCNKIWTSKYKWNESFIKHYYHVNYSAMYYDIYLCRKLKRILNIFNSIIYTFVCSFVRQFFNIVAMKMVITFFSITGAMPHQSTFTFCDDHFQPLIQKNHFAASFASCPIPTAFAVYLFGFVSAHWILTYSHLNEYRETK